MELTYKILDLTNIDPVHAPLVDQAYHLWQETYEPILKESNEVLDLDIFWRSKMLSVLINDNQVVGFHLYNIYDLNCEGILDHSYIKQIPQDRLQEILKGDIKKLMSCEFLTVNPKYRGKHLGYSMADLIIALSTTLLKYSPWDAIIGISRVDYKIAQKSLEVGCQIITDIQRHAIKCSIVLVPKDQVVSKPDLQIKRLSRDIWARKENYTPWIDVYAPQTHQRKAA